ncbi:MAG: chemotaxis protein CheB [Betaproteobacteria bacterium HGW-Betaproteobacteria-12]|nr:MAG: chemotaxis protein CheB [Betaproteobacteria bacterium HGW-Betaproteobacteria-12]
MSAEVRKSRPSRQATPAVVPVRPPGRDFPIVAIGASAGGLEALEQFLGHVPPASGMAFVVIQHLDPDRKDMLSELLQRTTPMPVMPARNRLKVRPDTVYVIPPNTDISILHGSLYLLDPVAPRGLRLPIDFFFHALAEDRRELAIGVILSGMGCDGTLGLRSIKEAGGLALVQEPASARYDSMPRSAIGAGLADIVARADELPLRIADTLRHLRPARLGQPPVGESAEQKSAFDKVCILLRARTGHDFSLYKKTTVYRRVERRMAIHQIERIGDYVRHLRENPQEIDLLFRELLIGVTSFFRDPATWDYLQQQVLPELLADRPESSMLRAWVPGCSTGEEAYTLAMVFREAMDALPAPTRHSLQIFATDLDPDAIEKARRGIYPANIAADVSPERLKRFFIDEGNGFRVSKEIREMVVFAPQDLIMDPPFTKLDIVSCRNLLIYLGAELQKRVLPLFHYSLKPGGVLLLGSAESIGGFTDLFVPQEGKARLFRRNDSPQRSTTLEFPIRDFANQAEPSMDSKPEAVTANLQHLADDLLLQQFAPAAVLVTASGDLVYISGRTGKYLEPAAGKVNWNIHAMARDGLRQELAIALPKALRSGERVVCHKLAIGSNGSTQLVDLTVQPISEPAALRGMLMLVFADLATPPKLPGKRGARRSERETELEQALLLKHQEVQSLREEMQSSHEELKSANEELQSTNEELQSANEELTTSKEEMQSLNEELQTVNVELQSKVDELSTANNDMKNLLNSTDIATVFLDSALHVRRFTTQATRLFKLIPGDLGRPLSDIVTDLDYPGLLDEAARVLNTLIFAEREAATADGRWFLVRIMPYRTLENVIDGVVITFNDISRAKQLEAELRALGRPAMEPR